ncbi:YggS family pyridoxal phosphate-dependent enzyme [Streptococcus himalayensis]|uniref:Pyridoxal phosphate homeostasis protein n=1 Tax=Streptococcus himalayensis TaxID=1888195 RepID=A0A917EFT1_9STRE|nr:YggS family pyridoxal phosphate-dependent enzyme [Streptococcus himalayensis]GGE34202.1 YggS family pyridoxal phosphate enzyme [Streptococcus himalayensis]
MDLQKNADRISNQVAEAALTANRRPEEVQVIAVTKYVDVKTAQALVQTGVRHIGENRVDKFLEKYEAMKEEPLTWHLIGTLQRRKVKDVINYVDYFHALDSLKLAQEIEKRATHSIKCFLQVNISQEETKHGFSAEEIEEVIAELAKLEKLEIVGLMTMAPIDATPEELKVLFQKTQDLQKRLQKKQLKNMPFTDLSMGMSRDYSIAIGKGSTFVRIGTAFFE